VEPSNESGLLTTQEAADALKTTPQFVRALIRRGALEGFNVSPGERTTWRIPTDALARYVVERNSR